MPLAPGAATCSGCGTASLNPVTASIPTAPVTFSYGGVSSWERILGVTIDVVLAAVTAGIGWLVWTAVLFSKRQTPAGRLRDKVIVDSKTARLASPGKYVARQVVVVLMFTYLVAGFFWGFGVVLDIGGFWVNTFVIPITLSLVIAVDILWVFLPPRRRLIDVILRTNVVEGQGISYLDSAPVGGGVL
jgi:hypothetical protein